MGWALSPLLLDEAGWLRDLARHHMTRSTCCSITCRLAWLQNPCVFHWTHGIKENNDHHLQFIHWKSPDFTDPDRNHDKGVRRRRDGRWGELEQFPESAGLHGTATKQASPSYPHMPLFLSRHKVNSLSF